MTPTPERRIYHFTHVDNLPAVFATGELVCDALSSRHLVTNVGNAGIKKARRTRAVPTGPRGTVSQYVPFYFATRSPMMYLLACNYGKTTTGLYSGGDTPLVYLVSSVSRVLAAGLSWAASDGNCAANVTEYTSASGDLDTHVDWALMDARSWANTPDDGDRMRRRMAEFLIHQRVPLDLMLGLATHSEHMARRVRRLLEEYGRTSVRLTVKSDWYYGRGPEEVIE